MRELREFRAHHDEFTARGMTVAGVSRDDPERCRYWRDRLRIPYLLLSDPEGEVGRAFGIVRRIGIGPWKFEIFRRTTFLIETGGRIAAAWGAVRLRGHAAEVLAAVDARD